MTLKEELEPIILSRAMVLRIRRLIADGRDNDLATALFERVATPGVSRNRLEDLVVVMDVAIKLAAKAMTGGNITRDDTVVLSNLCTLIGHEP